MFKILKLAITWYLPAVVAAFFVVVAMAQSKSVDPKKSVPEAKEELDQAKFMRKKLEASNAVLEGLVTENAQNIMQGARVLAEMSAAEQWQVKNDAMYRQFSSEFQRSATLLRDEAEKQNFDAAAVKWIDVTLKCIECHKFVRGLRIAGGKAN